MAVPAVFEVALDRRGFRFTASKAIKEEVIQMTVHQVSTSEYAPLGRRIVAHILDVSVILVVYVMVWKIPRVSVFDTTDIFREGLRFLALLIVYSFLFEAWYGRSIGKWLLRLRVVNEARGPCGFRRSFIRNIIRLVDWLPAGYLLALALIFSSGKRQRLGDRLAKTLVIRTDSTEKSPPPPAPFLFH